MESSLECGVCFNDYNSKDNRPKSLPCGHSICSACVKDTLKAKDGKMNCPFCRTSCGKESKNIDDFPTTYALLNLLDTIEHKDIHKTLSPREKEKKSLQQKKTSEYDRTGTHISNCNEHLKKLLHAIKLNESDITQNQQEQMRLEDEKKRLISEKHKLEDIVAEGNDIVKGFEALQYRVESASSLPGLNMASQDVQRHYTSSQEWATSRVNGILIEEKDPTNSVSTIGSGDSTVGITGTKSVSDEDKAEAEDLKNQGNQLMKKEKYFEALSCYTKAINRNNTNGVYYCNRAAANSKLDNHTDAIEDCKRALQFEPHYSKAYGRIGLVYSALNNHQKAKEWYKKAVELEPDNESYKGNLRIAEEKIRSMPQALPNSN